MPSSHERKFDKAKVIGNPEDSVCGVRIEGEHQPQVETMDTAVIEAANHLVSTGHTILHFTNVLQPDAPIGAGSGFRSDILVVGQRPVNPT